MLKLEAIREALDRAETAQNLQDFYQATGQARGLVTVAHVRSDDQRFVQRAINALIDSFDDNPPDFEAPAIEAELVPGTPEHTQAMTQEPKGAPKPAKKKGK